MQASLSEVWLWVCVSGGPRCIRSTHNQQGERLLSALLFSVQYDFLQSLECIMRTLIFCCSLAMFQPTSAPLLQVEESHKASKSAGKA